MAKRITEKRIKNWMILVGIVGIPLGIGLIQYLVELDVIEIMDYSGDMFTNKTTVFINMTFKPSEDIFINPMDSIWALETDNPNAIELIKMYRTWGKGLRTIDLNKTCTGSWCGCYWCTKYNTAKYVYVFRKGRTYTLVYELKIKPNSIIKWSWLNDSIDPYIVGYIDNYKTQYQTKIRFVEEITGTRTDKIYNNFTKQIEYRTIDVINVEQVKYKEPYLKKQGLIVGEKTYLNSFIKDDKLIIFNIPIGDRNLEEFGYCREYEKQKGVCWIKKLEISELIK